MIDHLPSRTECRRETEKLSENDEGATSLSNISEHEEEEEVAEGLAKETMMKDDVTMADERQDILKICLNVC